MSNETNTEDSSIAGREVDRALDVYEDALAAFRAKEITESTCLNRIYAAMGTLHRAIRTASSPHQSDTSGTVSTNTEDRKHTDTCFRNALRGQACAETGCDCWCHSTNTEDSSGGSREWHYERDVGLSLYVVGHKDEYGSVQSKDGILVIDEEVAAQKTAYILTAKDEQITDLEARLSAAESELAAWRKAFPGRTAQQAATDVVETIDYHIQKNRELESELATARSEMSDCLAARGEALVTNIELQTELATARTTIERLEGYKALATEIGIAGYRHSKEWWKSWLEEWWESWQARFDALAGKE